MPIFFAFNGVNMMTTLLLVIKRSVHSSKRLIRNRRYFYSSVATVGTVKIEIVFSVGLAGSMH